MKEELRIEKVIETKNKIRKYIQRSQKNITTKFQARIQSIASNQMQGDAVNNYPFPNLN